MLSDGELAWVRGHGWTTDHDVALMSALLGEPSLIGRLLVYRRGSKVFVCGWPLEGELTVSAGEILGVAAQAVEWGAEELHVWGTNVVDLPAVCPVWRSWYIRVPHDCDWLMRIDLNCYNDAYVKRQRNYRRAVSNRYTLALRRGFPGSTIVAPLVSRYVARPDIPPNQKLLIELSLQADLYEETTSFLALRDRKVVGIQVCRPVPEGSVFARWALFDGSAIGVSDFLYGQFIDYYRHAGAKVIDLGYGATPSLFSYKKRWGANAMLGPLRRYGFRRQIVSHPE